MTRGLRRSYLKAITAAVVVLAAGLAVAPGDLLGQARTWPTEAPPRPLPARDVKFPPYEIRDLTNGLKVVVVLHHEQPAVSMRLLVRAGAAYDRAGKVGLATLVSALLDQGTTTRSAHQIADTIDYIGGGLGAGAGSDLSFVNIAVMKDSFMLGMELLADVARNPAFAGEEIERQRQQALSAMKVSYEDPDYVAGSVFDRLVYGFNPYGLPNNGTPESLPGLTRDDLLEFHRRHFTPNNSILAIVGDVSAEEAFGTAEKIFGAWPRREVDAVRFADPPEPTRRVIVVNKPDAVQTEVRVGHLGVPRKHTDYMALNLAIKILGGEGANRLHRVLRTERGLTYGASAEMDTLKQSGDFVVETNTRSDATGEVLRLIVDEFTKLQRERVSDRELADAQAYLAGSFPLTIETPDAIATQVLNAIFYDLPLEDLQTYRQRVNAVTAEDIQRVAKLYLKPDRLSVVLVGNAAAFSSQLRGVGFGRFETVNLNELDLTTVDFRRAAQPAGSNRQPPHARPPPLTPVSLPMPQSDRPTPGNAGRGREIIAKAIEAKGGLDKLRGIKTIVAAATTTVPGPQGPVQTETRTYIEYPSRFRVEVKLPIGEIVQTYVDGHAWTKDPGGIHDVPEQMVDEVRASVKRDLLALLVGAASGKLQVRLLEQVAGDAGKPLDVVEVSGDDMKPIKLYVDATSGLVVRQTYVARGPQGEVAGEESFSDYRVVNGLQVAFKAVVRRGGATVLERTVTDFKYNVALEPDLFKKPS